MTRHLVTGAAGFIGSTLVDCLLADGHDVVGVDCFTAYYDRSDKERNLEAAREHPRFEFHPVDLRSADLEGLLDGVAVVYHQAGQPGVRLSWSSGFEEYVTQNVLATQRLLEAARSAALRRFVYASSSSVYGNAPSYPTTEDDLPRPHSPYGVTKLAGEHLCGLYAENFGVPTAALRYFTVYGPRQRPDMAMHRLIESALGGENFELFGTGEQIRDFTYVGDVVSANLAAVEAEVPPGTVVNVAGGGAHRMNEVVALVAELAQVAPKIVHRAEVAGDVWQTGGSTASAETQLRWRPITSLRDGLAAQVLWHRSRRSARDEARLTARR